MRGLAAVGVVAMLMTPTRTLRAQSADAESTALYAESATAYKVGHFAEASRLLLRAYERSHAPVLLYNLARAYEGSGRSEDALQAYHRYLQAEPNPPDRGAIDERCATLQRAIDQKAALDRQRSDAEQRTREREARRPEAEEPARGRSLLPWVTLGTGVAALGAGGLLGVVAEGKHHDATEDPSATSAGSKQSSAQSLATAADICFVAGGVLAAGAVVWALVDGQGAAPRSSSAVYVAPTLGGVILGKRF